MLALTGLDYEPEQWTAIDSLAWLKAMAWDLRGNMNEEIARTRLSVDRTPEQVDELYPRYPFNRNAPIVHPAWKPAGDREPETGAGTCGAAGARRGAARGRRDPRPDGQGRRDRVQQLGGVR